MAAIGAGVSLRGLDHIDFHYAFNLAAGITQADTGKAVALDPTAANTVKLAGAGDHIMGKLVTVENRVVEGILVGTVVVSGGFAFTKAAAAQTIAVGDTVVGFLAGEVGPRRNAGNTANEPDPTANIVVEVVGNQITVLF